MYNIYLLRKYNNLAIKNDNFNDVPFYLPSTASYTYYCTN